MFSLIGCTSRVSDTNKRRLEQTLTYQAQDLRILRTQQSYPASQATGVPGVQVPSWHVSFVVHGFPALQGDPFSTAGLLQVPVPGSHVPAAWHWSPATHDFGLPPTQTPATHVSVCVQALPSLQPVPSVAAGFEQVPVPGSHVPAVWHWSLAVHDFRLPPTQTPAMQVSVCVHAFPSLQPVPSVAAGFEHVPFAGLHVPAAWHWSLAVHDFGLPPTQAPATQVSVCVHAFPSLQLVPSAATGLEHVPFAGLHVPAAWHWSLAVHDFGLPPTQAPATQVSVCVHAFPSLQLVPSAATGLEHVPFAGLHVPAVWHWSLAVHDFGLPPTQAPATHVSVCVHAFPSLQAVPSAFVGLLQVPVAGLHVPAVWH